MPAYLSLSCTRTHVTRPRHAYLILPFGCTGTTRCCMRRTTSVGPAASADAAEVVSESERPRPLLLALFDTFVFSSVPSSVVVLLSPSRRIISKLNWFKYIQIARYTYIIHFLHFYRSFPRGVLWNTGDFLR